MVGDKVETTGGEIAITACNFASAGVCVSPK
jgi:hypothetical protein